MFSSRRILTLAVVLFFSVIARAQFVLSENEATSVRWKSIEADGFRVIYQEGCDTMAGTYLSSLSRYRLKNSYTLGLYSGQYQKKPLDVILYSRNARSNGVVTWTPSRMELYISPQYSGMITPLPWYRQLTIHEGRHAAQMQNGYRKVFKPFYYILGQIIPSAGAAYPGTLLLEGDAVVAETELSHSGRGRITDFQEYYMYSFDNGDNRNWMRWRYGSHYKYTPDNYALGYFLISGMRARYDAPLFMADYMDYVSRRPYDPWPLRHTMRRNSGVKFRESYASIVDFHHSIWKENVAARAPFDSSTVIAPETKRLVTYSNPLSLDGGRSLWIKKDIYHCSSLVCLAGQNTEKRLSTLSSAIGRINISGDESTLYWNEVRSNPRWGMVNRTVVREFDINTGKTTTLKLPRGIYVNPVEYSADTLAVIEYGTNGRNRINLVKGNSIIEKINIPTDLQPVHITVMDRNIYALAINEDGEGLWVYKDSVWTNLLSPTYVAMSSLTHKDGRLLFSSEKNGVNEYYSYDPESGKVFQLTNSRYGATDFAAAQDGGILQSQYNTNGTRAVKTAAGDIAPKETDPSQTFRYKVADILSAQADSLERAYGPSTHIGDTSVTAPVRYKKGKNAIRFHSWAPAYVDIDNIDNISFNNIQKTASLGAMGFFQNSMSTLSGYVAYKAEHRNRDTWFHSGHLSLTYSGLYPVFELKAQVGDGRAQHGYYNEKRDTLFFETTDKPYTSATLNTYVPLSWNRGSWNFGVIPQLKLLFSNSTLEDRYNFDIHAGVRAYAIQNTPSACVYPRWGIGAEFQYMGKLSYAFLYGYVPGICCGQGLKLTGVYQMSTKGLSPFINSYSNLFPRGYTARNPYSGAKLTAEYAIPFSMGDWHIIDMLYCSRAIITPHFDWSYLSSLKGDLYSAGASFEMEFKCFFWLKNTVTVGVTASYNGGTLRRDAEPYYVGAIFGISLPN